jgi:N-dimethylarginine dimethylaminohydrolase
MKSMRKILLCRPDYFDIEYEINPWMHIENKVNKANVQQEYAQLKSLIENLGAEVLEIEPQPNLPDMVYTANLGYVDNNKFIVANFKFPERQKESKFAKKYFADLGFEVLELPSELIWEGQGDLLSSGDKLFAGYGKRSDLDAANYIENILNKKIIKLELIDPYYYHLDTCFAPLDENLVVINDNSFTEEALESIYENFEKVILTSDNDNKFLCCNLITIDKNILVSKGISDKLISDFQNFGYEVHLLEMNEFQKGGGSVRCLTLDII